MSDQDKCISVDFIRQFLEGGGAIFHVHIPKTGGTYVNTAFQNYTPFLNGGHCFKIGGEKARGHKPAEGRYWPSFEDKGMKAGQKKVSIIRNPFAWLLSYYFHVGYGFRGLIKHNGWQGVVDYHKFKTFEAFVNAYCDPEFDWHVSALHKCQLGQLLDQNNKLDVDALIYNELLGAGVSQVADLINFESSQVNANRGSKRVEDYRKHYTASMVDKVERKLHKFINLTGYEFDDCQNVKISAQNQLGLCDFSRYYSA